MFSDGKKHLQTTHKVAVKVWRVRCKPATETANFQSKSCNFEKVGHVGYNGKAQLLLWRQIFQFMWHFFQTTRGCQDIASHSMHLWLRPKKAQLAKQLSGGNGLNVSRAFSYRWFFFFFGFRFDSELSFFWLMLPNVHRPANTEELQLNSFIQHHLTCYGLTTQRVSGEVVALLDYQTGISVWPKLMKDSNLAQWIVLHSVEFLGFAD